MNAVDPRTGLNGWQELGTALADAANGIVQAFESLPWGEIAKGIGQTISTFLSKSDIDVKLALGALIITKIASVLLGSAVAKGIGQALGGKILGSLGEAWPSLGGKLKGRCHRLVLPSARLRQQTYWQQVPDRLALLSSPVCS